MNLLHLKYAVEVAKTASFTQAAENLYMGQPNLSRAIKDLEDDLGIEIFRRTSKGIFLTSQGEVFLDYAKSILSQVDAMERLYKKEPSTADKFSISVPRANYIIAAFSDFVRELQPAETLEMQYCETSSYQAISNIVDAGYRLAVIRFPASYDSFYRKMLTDKNLHQELILEFSHVALFSKDSPLAKKDSFTSEDLNDLIELSHGDPSIPNLDRRIRQTDSSQHKRRILLCDRGSQMDLLSAVPNAFMWVSPVPQPLLDRYGLVQRLCLSDQRKYKDILVYQNGYRLSPLDETFVSLLMHYKDMIS